MKRKAFSFLMILLVAGCSRAGTPAPAPSAPPPEISAPQVQESALPPAVAPAPVAAGLPAVGAVIKWDALPFGLQEITSFPSPSPDGKWATATVPSDQWRKGLFILSTARDKAWYVDDGLKTDGARPLVWTPRNTLIYHHHYGGDVWDTWYEADPATGRRTEFASEALTGRSVREFRFAPDGRRLLADAGGCDGCNKPSENAITTYLIDLASGAVQEIGVDVQAEWDGDQVKVVAEAPHMGYSGQAFWDALGAGLRRPLSDSLQVGATDYVEYRVYRAGAGPGEAPLRVIPAYNTVDGYNSWGLWWPDPPEGPFRLEAWAEVRATVPDPPPKSRYGMPPGEIRWENGKRWAVVFSRELTLNEGAPRQTVLLRKVQMWDKQNGWGVGYGGRILRTADGGATWRDVSPAGFARCVGRYDPRQIESFGTGTAVVALACDRTGPDGNWTRESGRISVFRTLDGGATWTASGVDTDYRFAAPAAIQLVDAASGWLVARPSAGADGTWNTGALYRTDDGGETWKKVTDTNAGLPGSRDVWFLDNQRGWAVGQGSRSLWVTEDGGLHWRREPVDLSAYPVDGGYLFTPRFVTPTEGYFVAGGYVEGAHWPHRELYWSRDGGQTWEKRSAWDGERRPVFLTPEVGYTWEYEVGTVNWTYDGGRTWEARKWETDQSRAQVVQFLDEQNGFAAQGPLWNTENGGQTWHETLPSQP